MFMMSIFLSGVQALPHGPSNFTISESGRNILNTAAAAIEVAAGNVTALVIDGTRITEAWAGYYGNVSGDIVLDDSSNFTLYDWSLPSPAGEVYAANGSNVVWGSVYCMNVSGSRNSTGSNGNGDPNGNVYAINGSQIELNFGINVTDTDGLNETFNDTYSSATGFVVGDITINVADGCSMAHTYTDESVDANWQEFLLTDNQTLIFTTIIRQDTDSYQPGTNHLADFQMIVLEDGHAGADDTTTSYYFYVELT